ncbi:MAG: TolC family protein [Fusobacterium sp.]|nr:TolC family protein [Fusobacterium sp.]
MRINNKIILCAMILFVSCSKVDIKKENKIILEDLNKKEQITREFFDKNNMEAMKENYLYLDEAIDYALKNNTQIKLKEIEEKIAKLDKRIAFGNFLPKISGAYTISEMDRHLTTTIENPQTSLEIAGINLSKFLPALPTTISNRMVDKSFRHFAITAQMPVFVPATWFLYSAREKGENISKYSKDLTKKMIRLKVMSEFYYILALMSEKDILLAELNYAKTLNKNARVALETGSILDWEYKQSKLLLKQKESSIKNNERDLKTAKMMLMKDLNLDVNFDFIPVAPENEISKDLKLEDLIYEALTHSELININHNLVGINKDKIKIAISSFLPQIVVSGGLFGTGSAMFMPQNILMGTIGSFLSIFNGFKNVNEYKKAKLEDEKAYLKREEIVMYTVMAVVNTYNNYQKSLEEKELADFNYRVAKDKFSQKKLQNEVGYINDTDYMNEITALEKAASLKAKADYKFNVVAEALNLPIGKNISKEN